MGAGLASDSPRLPNPTCAHSPSLETTLMKRVAILPVLALVLGGAAAQAQQPSAKKPSNATRDSAHAVKQELKRDKAALKAAKATGDTAKVREAKQTLKRDKQKAKAKKQPSAAKPNETKKP
jgi:hypothetical protein